MAQQALSGLKVVELGDFISAAYCTKLMADMGAEVIKVEKPITGDSIRQYGPFPGDVPHPEKSGLHLYLNANKSGVTLDVATPTGARIFKDLIKDADFLVENNSPQTMKALGLDYESLSAINPRLIMTSITIYGQEGLYSEYKGYHINISAGSGIAYHTGDPKRSPLMTPILQSHYLGGVHGAAATMAAHFGRKKTGKGQHVDISEMDAVATEVMGGRAVTYRYRGGPLPKRQGHRLLAFYPWTVLPCKDGYVGLVTTYDRHWDKFVELIGDPSWKDNPRYHKRYEMPAYADEVDALITPWLMAHTKQEIWEFCAENKLPFQPVQNAEDLLKAEHLKTREFFVEVEVPEGGKVRVPGAPYKLSETPWQFSSPAPKLGEHNVQVFCDRLGYSKQDLVKMAHAGIV